MSRGLTLVELVVALAIGAILFAIGAPACGALLHRLAWQAAVQDLYGALEFARAYAIGHGSRVVVAPADANGADWGQGWTVFVDRDGDALAGAGERILLRHAPLPAYIATAAAFTQPGRAYIAYNAAGRSCTAGSSTAVRAGNITLSSGGEARRIRIALLGRARICDPVHDRSCAD
ncbi:MAG: GspH/FimT family pseudopilin [Telluria sp.]